MRGLPDSLFTRLALLLALVLLATMAVSAWTLRAISLYAGGDQIADLLAGQIVAQQALLRHPAAPAAGGGEPVLDLRLAPAPPARAMPVRLPFLRRIEARLQLRLGAGTQLRLEEDGESRLWVRTPSDPRWFGIAVPPFAQQATQLTLVVLVVSIVTLLLAAAWFTRRLARPLAQLGQRAGALLAGAPVPADELSGPRELRLIDRALRDAATARANEERERATMLAGLSHDLRTPLARLRLALELDPGDPQLRQGMVLDIEVLDAILTQFIDFARGAAGEAVQRVDLAALARDVAAVERLDPRQWTWPDAAMHLPFEGKPLALQRALVNLVRNALRHGAPPYRIELEGDAAGTRLRVIDAGAGVAAEQLGRLAQPFVRGDAARSGDGSGLGLAVAAQVAREHGGALRLRSAPGEGFVAELDLRAPR